MKILLLNPPGDGLYVRDYYCSKTSKANYIYHPVDLLLLSGILASRHEIMLLDAIVDRMSRDTCLEKIKQENPDMIIALTGAVSVTEDISFFQDIKKVMNIPIYASGDILMEEGVEFLKRFNCLDGIILDFTSSEILQAVNGGRQVYDTIIYRSEGAIIPSSGRLGKGEIEIPIPRHDLFLPHCYTYPFISSHHFATVLTDYGCPYRCTFCIMGTLTYKYRSIGSVKAELAYIHSLDIREIYFSDQTFGAVKKRARDICEEMIEKKYNFGWVCFSRADITDESLISLMKKAGCHTIIYGVETGNETLMNQYRKDMSRETLKSAFNLCRSYGIKTVATYVIGLPEDDRKTITETINFAKELDSDYASFNIYVPRKHTRLREVVLEMGLFSRKTEVMDQSGSYSITGTKFLSAKEVFRLKNKAVREFYLRPSYLIRRLSGLKSYRDLKREWRGGVGIMKDILKQLLSRSMRA